MAYVLWEKLVCRKGLMTICGCTVKTVTEAGITSLTCTLPPHEDKSHYDDVFCMGWKEA